MAQSRDDTREACENVVILGGGPAGIAAALQLRRQGIDPLLIERDRLGGLLWNANCIENYPGLPDPLPGPELAQRLALQLRRAGVRRIGEDVRQVALSTAQGDAHLSRTAEFRLTTTQRPYRTRHLIIASGTRANRPRDLAVPPEAAAQVHTEVAALRDLRKMRVAIVGAGDAAFDYALNLGRHNDVLILARRAHSRALPLLRQRVAASPRIRYRAPCRVQQIAQSSSGRLRLTCDGETAPLEVDHLIFAIGREPAVGFLAPDVAQSRAALSEQGLLYFAGDVQSGIFRQAAIAAGDGIRVAMQIAQHRRKGRG